MVYQNFLPSSFSFSRQTLREKAHRSPPKTLPNTAAGLRASLGWPAGLRTLKQWGISRTAEICSIEWLMCLIYAMVSSIWKHASAWFFWALNAPSTPNLFKWDTSWNNFAFSFAFPSLSALGKGSGLRQTWVFNVLLLPNFQAARNRYDSIWDQLVPGEFLNMPKLCSLCKKHFGRFSREYNLWNRSWQFVVASKTILTYWLYLGPLWTVVSWADGPGRLFFDPTPVLNMSQTQTSNRTSHFEYWKALVQRSKWFPQGKKNKTRCIYIYKYNIVLNAQ